MILAAKLMPARYVGGKVAETIESRYHYKGLCEKCGYFC